MPQATFGSRRINRCTKWEETAAYTELQAVRHLGIRVTEVRLVSPSCEIRRESHFMGLICMSLIPTTSGCAGSTERGSSPQSQALDSRAIPETTVRAHRGN